MERTHEDRDETKSTAARPKKPPRSERNRSTHSGGQRSRQGPKGDSDVAGSTDPTTRLLSTLGNQTIQRLAKAGTKPPFHLSDVGSPSEREANRIADALARRPTAWPGVKSEVPSIEAPAPTAGEGLVRPDISAAIKRSRGGGRPLPAPVREDMEPAFGRDLGDVRIHEDVESGVAAAELAARAFTTGQDIFFGRGEYRPETSEGRHLLAHELAHTVQQAASGGPSAPIQRQAIDPGGMDPRGPTVGPRQPTAGPGETVTDQEQSPTEEPARTPIEVRVAVAEPDLFFVPVNSSREQIARHLYGDETRMHAFDYVQTVTRVEIDGIPARAVRSNEVRTLATGPLSALRWALDKALTADVRWTINKLSEGVISGGDESALAEMAVRWSQRSDIPTQDGTSYFDAYLERLDAVTLSQPHWYTFTFTETERTALEWLLRETEEQSEQIKKAIELRSTSFRGRTGYTVDEERTALRPGTVVGRFYFSDGGSIQLFVTDTIAIARTREEALQQTRDHVVHPESATGLGMGIVVPESDGFVRGYGIYVRTLGKEPLDDPAGRFAWYPPGTVLVSEHHIWEEATRDQFVEEVRGQQEEITSDLLSLEAQATRIRMSAVGEQFPQEVFDAWARANQTVIILGRAVQTGTVETALRRQVVDDVTTFFNAFRRLVAPKDVTSTTRSHGEYWTITRNPYLTAQSRDLMLGRLERASSMDDWRAAISNYYRVVSAMDEFVASVVKQERPEEAERLIQAGQLTRNLDRLLREHPTAMKVRAVFYAQDQMEKEGAPTATRIRATPYPLLFYVYREDDEWILEDLTTPKQAKVTSTSGGTAGEPPLSLFEALNTKLRFPRGRLYWEMPDRTIYTIRTTEPISFTDWLTWIGLGLAALGLITATAGAATPATVLFVGSAVTGAAAGVADIVEKSEAGVLTERDIMVDVVSIVGSLASGAAAGAGRIVGTSGRVTGRMARVAALADRVYVPALGVSITADTITLATVADDLWTQYQAIQNGSGDDEAKSLALRRLVTQGLLTGGITLLAVRGDVADFRKGRRLYLDRDVAGGIVARPMMTPEELTRGLGDVVDVAELNRILRRPDLSPDVLDQLRADLTEAVRLGDLPRERLTDILESIRAAPNETAVREQLTRLRRTMLEVRQLQPRHPEPAAPEYSPEELLRADGTDFVDPSAVREADRATFVQVRQDYRDYVARKVAAGETPAPPAEWIRRTSGGPRERLERLFGPDYVARTTRGRRIDPSGFMADAEAKATNPKHPLHSLTVVRTTTRGIEFGFEVRWQITRAGPRSGRFAAGPTGGRGEYVMQAGHKYPFSSGERQILMLEDADLNVGPERRTAVKNYVKIGLEWRNGRMVGDEVHVELETAKLYEARGALVLPTVRDVVNGRVVERQLRVEDLPVF